MAYQKTEWKDHIVETPNKYAQTTNPDGTVTLAKREGNVVQAGTPMSASNLNKMEQGILEAHGQLDQSARASQVLKHGLSVLNGSQTAPVNLQIEGRTLIPMQNNVLDASKHYILGGKKYALKWADSSKIYGVAKLTGKAERPQLITIGDFADKKPGVTLVNPHKAKYLPGGDRSTLLFPADFVGEYDADAYNLISSQDGRSTNFGGTAVAGHRHQALFSFDLLNEVENSSGRIPRATMAGKVEWLRANISRVGFTMAGRGVGGLVNRLEIGVLMNGAWLTGKSSWGANETDQIANVGLNIQTMAGLIDASGIAHFHAYAPLSTEAGGSYVFADYVKCEIELKPDAVLHDPRAPLYEVEKSVYDELLVTIPETDVIARYPSVEGVTHLQNPYAIAEGENLLDLSNPVAAWQSTAEPTPNGVKITATATSGVAYVEYVAPAVKGQTYALSLEAADAGMLVNVHERRADNTEVALRTGIKDNGVFTTNESRLVVRLYVNTTGAIREGLFKVMLVLGSVPKPFIPYNPSYALFETKLAKIGTVADRLFEQDGKFIKRKSIISDVSVDSSKGWVFDTDLPGFKRFKTGNLYSDAANFLSIVTNPFGKVLGGFRGPETIEDQLSYPVSGRLYVSASDIETGFADAYTPVSDEVAAFFNGWKVKTTEAGTNKPTAWASVVDGSDAPTQTLAYVAANKAPNYTPYKLSYVLAAPVIEEIKAEGSITVNGLTQIEVGSGVIVREKATPVINSTGDTYVINHIAYAASLLKNKALKILDVYKNGEKVKGYTTPINGANGAVWISFPKALIEPAAEYTVTYSMFDRQKFTTNATNVLASYANNVRAALEDVVKQSEDVRASTTVNTLLIYEMLKRLKAGGL